MAVRKRATKMTAAERQRFRDVITTLIQNGTYGQLVYRPRFRGHRVDGIHAATSPATVKAARTAAGV